MAATPGAPAQVWGCGVAGHRHLAKAEAVRCLEGHDQAAATAPGGHGANAAALEHGRPAEPAHKGLGEAGRLAQLIIELDWLHDRIAIEAAMEADPSPLAARLQGILAEVC